MCVFVCTDDSVGAEVQEGEAISVGRPTVGSAEETSNFTLPRGKVLTTPAVRRMASEHKVKGRTRGGWGCRG